MKLKDDSIFDRAVIVTLADNNLYYEYATRLPLMHISHFDDTGIKIYKGTAFDNKYMFWVENNNAYPIIKVFSEYLILDSDEEFEFLIKNNLISKDEYNIIKEGLDVLNRIIVKGGLAEQ